MHIDRTVVAIKRSIHLVLLMLLLLAVAPIREPTLQAAYQVPVIAASQPQIDLCNQAIGVNVRRSSSCITPLAGRIGSTRPIG
jgi:hypothetical protein